MITLTKTINKLPKNPLLKTNKGEHRFEMNIKTITGNHQQASPQAPYFLHFLRFKRRMRSMFTFLTPPPRRVLDGRACRAARPTSSLVPAARLASSLVPATRLALGGPNSQIEQANNMCHIFRETVE